MKSVSFGIHLPMIGFAGETAISKEQLISYAQKAEELGYDSLSVNDHIVDRTGWLNAICSLSAIAATTHRIKIGTSILNLVMAKTGRMFKKI